MLGELTPDILHAFGDNLKAMNSFLDSWNAALTGSPILRSQSGYGYGGYGCEDLPEAKTILCPSKDYANINTCTVHDFARSTNSTTDAAWVLVDDLYALNFDGTHTLTVPAQSAFSQTAAPHSFSFWIKADSVASGTILEMPFRYKIFLSGGNLYYRVFEDSESYFGRYVTAPDTSAMHHVVINWEFGNQSEDISIYIDGEHVEGIFQAVEGFGNYNADIADWTIGEGLDGKLDDIRFFQSVLTLGNITLLSSERGVCLAPTTSNGVVGGGQSLIFGVTNLNGTGGVVSGGTPNIYAQFNPDVLGGVVAAGQAANAKIVIAGTDGGAVAGGSSTDAKIVAVEPAGGMVAGGLSQTSTYLSEIVSGGLVAGGESDVSITLTLASGGVLGGGEAVLRSSTSVNGSGGVVGGGSAAITTNITEYASGGVVVVQNRFANGYAYRLPLTIPADKVAADLHNFPVGVILQLSSSDFVITDSVGNVLDHEVRDQDDDFYWLFFKASLSSSQDNQFYVYFGGE